MEHRTMAATMVLAFLMIGVYSAPSQLGASSGSGPAPSGGVAGTSVPAAHMGLNTASPVPSTTFPRTVLLETFTGVWCPHCPAETQALYDLDHKVSHSVIAISELHVCGFAPPKPCYDNYVAPDNTSYTRGSFYSVCGYPDVFVDGNDGPPVASKGGLDQLCGAGNSAPQMEATYNNSIANASVYPGNVSISESAHVIPGNVTAQVNITSGITGSYNAVVYLVEYIGKVGVNNGGGPHSIGWVVRETLRNHPLALTAGQTTEINATGPMISGWNQQNFSVVSFVQDNATPRTVENANMAPVTTELTSITLSQSQATSGTATKVTIRVLNSSTGSPLSNAVVNLSSSLGGVFTPASGLTALDGTFTSQYTAPNVTVTESATISAQVTATNYTLGIGSADMAINPIIPSSIPTGLTVTPALGEVALNWTVPPSGSTGISYHVYRSSSQGGTYTQVGVTTLLNYVDLSVSPGQGYWYEVNSHGGLGFSANTSAISATPVTAVTQGLPLFDGWWFAVDSMNFTSSTNASMTIYLPEGIYFYTYGPGAYGFVTTEPSSPVSVVDTPISVTVVFQPLFATLTGKVTPASATVTLDGTAISVVDGSFLQLLVAGSYTVNVTASGYSPSTNSVILTAGNTTTLNVALHPLPTTGGPVTASNNGGLSGDEMVAIIGVVAAVGVAAVLGGFMIVSGRGKRGQPPMGK